MKKVRLPTEEIIAPNFINDSVEYDTFEWNPKPKKVRLPDKASRGRGAPLPGGPPGGGVPRGAPPRPAFRPPTAPNPGAARGRARGRGA